MPVGGSVDEGVAMLRYGEGVRPLFTCWYEAAEHVGGRLPSRVMFPFLPRRVVGHYLAYKTTRKQADRVVRATAVEAVESPLIGSS